MIKQLLSPRGGVAPLYKNSQGGRSMIEMLGVLAIVGVLSVVGIAGFHSAMGKYKINKVREQMHDLSANLTMLLQNTNTYKVLGNNPADMAKRLGAVPDSMMKSDAIRHAFGGTVDIEVVDYAGIEGGAFTLKFNDLPPDAAVALGIDDANVDNKDLMYIQIGHDQ